MSENYFQIYNSLFLFFSHFLASDNLTSVSLTAPEAET